MLETAGVLVVVCRCAQVSFDLFFHHCVSNAPSPPWNEWFNCLLLLIFLSWRRLSVQHPCELQAASPFDSAVSDTKVRAARNATRFRAQWPFSYHYLLILPVS